MLNLVRALWRLFAIFCSLYGICSAFKEGGFFWILVNFIPPVGTIHGFGHFFGIF